MFKKLAYKKRKEIKQSVQDFRNAGKMDGDIYAELRKHYDQKWSLYCIINSIPSKHLKKTYRFLNHLLIVLLGLVILGKTSLALFQFFQDKQLISLLPLLICLLLAYILVQIKNYNAPYYYAIVVIAFLGLRGNLQIIQDVNFDLMSTQDMVVFGFLQFAGPIIIGVLSFYLARKLFPHFKITTAFSKGDENGEYGYLLGANK